MSDSSVAKQRQTQSAAHEPTEDHLAIAARFLACHGSDAYEAVLGKLDVFLSEHKISMLDDALQIAPIFGNLLSRSRKQLLSAIDGINEHEAVWMILTHDPTVERRRESLIVRAVVGPCGPIKVSFEDTLGGGR